MTPPCELPGEDALISAIVNATSPIAFMLGSALSAPEAPSSPGVPMSSGVVEIARVVASEYRVRRQFEEAIKDNAGAPQYQLALETLHSFVHQDAVCEVVARAVRKSRTAAALEEARSSQDLEKDHWGWYIPSGLRGIAKLLVNWNAKFAGPVVTTNFDPLIAVAIHRERGHSFQTVLDSDGAMDATHSITENAVQIVHLHGYWIRHDNLHTRRQLATGREHLESSLRDLLRTKTLVVLGYSGWDDSFMRALAAVISDRQTSLDVLWCLHSSGASAAAEQERIMSSTRGGSTTRLRFYQRIDCNTLPQAMLRTLSQVPIVQRPQQSLRNEKQKFHVLSVPKFPAISRLRWSPDGHSLAAGLDDTRALVWSCPGAKFSFSSATVLELLHHEEPVRALGWSSDGRWLATGSIDGAIAVWSTSMENASIRVPVWYKAAHQDWIRSLGWNGDSTLLAAGAADRTVSIWSVTGELVHILSGHGGIVRCVAWAHDSNFLATASADCQVNIWDASTMTLVRTFSDARAPVISVAWHDSNDVLAAGCANGTVVFWRVSSGELSKQIPCSGDSILEIDWSRSGSLAVGCSDGAVRIVDLVDDSPRLHAKHGRSIRTLAWHPTSPILATGGSGGEISVSDVATGVGGDLDVERVIEADSRVPRAPALKVLSRESAFSLALAPDARSLAVGLLDRGVAIWDLCGTREVLILTGWSYNETHDKRATVRRHRLHEAVRAVAWSPDGALIAGGADDGKVRIWQPPAEAPKFMLEGHSDVISSVAWHRSGVALASGGADRVVRVWRRHDEGPFKAISVLTGHGDWVTAVAWSCSGTLLATASLDRTVKIWSPFDGRQVGDLHMGGSVPTSLSWAPTTDRLAVGFGSGELLVWGENSDSETFRQGFGAPVSVLWGLDERALVILTAKGWLARCDLNARSVTGSRRLLDSDRNPKVVTNQELGAVRWPQECESMGVAIQTADI